MHSSLLHVSLGDESPTFGLGTVETHQPFLQVFSKKQHTYANVALMFRDFIPEALLVKIDQGQKLQLVASSPLSIPTPPKYIIPQ